MSGIHKMAKSGQMSYPPPQMTPFWTFWRIHFPEKFSVFFLNWATCQFFAFFQGFTRGGVFPPPNFVFADDLFVFFFPTICTIVANILVTLSFLNHYGVTLSVQVCLCYPHWCVITSHLFSPLKIPPFLAIK